MTLAVDVSNYTDPLTPQSVENLKAAGVEMVIAQAIDPPPGYPAGCTRQQIETCLAAGLHVDAYIWLWFDLDARDIERKLALLDGLAVRQLWLDVEDQSAARFDQATCEAKVDAALMACDARRGTNGQPAGVYTGRWFWADQQYMGNTTRYADRELWDANYDHIADAAVGFVPYGGWTAPRIKQYQGSTSLAGVSGLDLNVLSLAEQAELEGDVPDNCDALINGMAYVGDDLGDRLLVETERVTVRKKTVRAIVAEMQRVRAETVGPRP